MLKPYLEKLLAGQDLSTEESSAAIGQILSGVPASQVAAFLMLLRQKKETADELLGAVLAMRSRMVPVSTSFPVLDIVGTGGDGAHTLNISTAASFVAASCGVKIAKHGNRSVSSLSGSADVIEALGIPLGRSPEEISRSIAEVGIGFMFAPDFHPALKQVRELRKELSMRTLFNIVGPLVNPASAEHLMVGVFHEELLELCAQVLFKLQAKRSFVFHGCGLDELSCIGPSQVIEVSEKGLRSFILDPKDYGLKSCTLEDLKGKDAAYNAAMIVKALEGEESPFADTIALNAGVAVYLYGITPSIQEGIFLSKRHLKDKSALNLLNRWKSHD